MRKTILALGTAVIALTSVNVGAPQAAVKFPDLPKLANQHWALHKGHSWVAPRRCFWVKKRKWSDDGWYWKKVRMCKPWWHF